MTSLLRNGGPWWKQVLGWTLPAFLVLYLLGAIPGLQSPLLANQALFTKHEDTTKELLRTIRLVCRGVWKDSAAIQRECDAP